MKTQRMYELELEKLQLDNLEKRLDKFYDDYMKKTFEDKSAPWKNNKPYTRYTGSTAALNPLVKGIHKLFEDAYVPIKKNKTFLEEVVEIEDED